MENWAEDTCCVCNVVDTNFLDDACPECTEKWNNCIGAGEFAKACIEGSLTMDKIDAYLGGK